jgi:rhodanese-related sulfurtransferase
MFGMKKTPTETPAEISSAMSRGEIVLVDVREAQEFAAERIPGALLYPLSAFDPAALPACPEGRRIVFHCGSGKRSEAAYEKAVRAGRAVSGHMGGGIAAWKAAGLPVLRLDPADGHMKES